MISLAAAVVAFAILLPVPAPRGWMVDPPIVPERPNILVVYIDDAAAHDARLWSNPLITPTITNRFVAPGIRFSNAIVEDPLCCPARGNLLTGLHTHNNGVITNDIRMFNPGSHLATALKGAGYTTIWSGKYLNKPYALPKAAWAPHYAAWDRLDVTFGTNDRVQTATGLLRFPKVHSTTIIGNRVAQHIREAPPDKPIFAVMSIFNLHVPNKPVAQTPERFALCDSIPAWSPPNYNEADVSDKPAYIQSRPLLASPTGWSMRKYCREMLGVDDAVTTVINELELQGRLDNTLLVFTADNGMAWGAHRLGDWKLTPYTTQVPLYMSWPTRWGSEPRVIADHVTNIDLAPTFCELAGCTLGPFATGQGGPDGLSLVNLIENGVSPPRDALLEQSPVGYLWTPAWWAVRTTALNPLGLWHYVEYETGELELYDLAADPYELDNLATTAAYAAVRDALALRLRALREEGRVNRPDLRAALLPDANGGYYIGYNVFDDAPHARQTARRTRALRNVQYEYNIELENNSLATDSFTLTAQLSGSPRFIPTILIDEVDVTAAMLGSGGVQFADMTGESVRHITLRVLVKPFARNGHQQMIDFRAVSNSNPGRVDVVRVVTRR